MARATDDIDAREDRCDTVLQRLRQNSIQATRKGKSWGFLIEGITNPRTGSEWHSVEEANALIREKQG